MEFSRRGRATGGAGDAPRFPDPPPAHGEREPMLVMRDALLSQLHMALLRQEIIEAELAKIERDMALRAAIGGHQTQTMPMPMPWHDMATTDAGSSQLWPFSAKQPMAGHNAEFDEHKLPDSSKDALLTQLHMARLRQDIIEAEVAQIERAMALRTTTGGHQTQTTQMPMPWHGVAAADAGRSKPWPFNADQAMAQQNAEFDEHKLSDSNKVIPPSKAPPAEKWELTGIKIPVTKPKLPMKWDCTVCQVQATSEQNLQQHYDGQKHLSNVATLDPTTKICDQKAKSAAEHTLGTEQTKTSSIKWRCSTCQANGTSHSTFEAHLKGKRHQQNITATCLEGNMDGMPKNIPAQLAKLHGINVPKNSEKLWPFITEQPMAQEFDELPESNKAVPPCKTSPVEKWELTEITMQVKKPKQPMIWNCTVCQVQAASEQDLQKHYAEQKHLSNVATLDPRTNASDQKAQTTAETSLGTEQKKTPSINWSCSTCQANGTSQSTLESHLKGKRHQQNITATCLEGNMDGMPKNIPTQEAKSHGINVPKNYPTTKASDQKPKLAAEQKKISSIEWSCSTCQANGTSHSTFEAHLKGKRHQQNITATFLQGNMDGMPKNIPAQETKSHGINLPKNSEKPCPFITEKPMAQEFDELPDSNKAVPPCKTSPAEKWELTEITIPVKKPKLPMIWNCTVCQVQAASEQDLQQHYAEQKHLTNVASLDPRTNASDQKVKTAKGPSLDTEQKKTPPVNWSCSTCQTNGTSQSTLESHLKGKRHQQNIAATSAEGDKNSMTRNTAAQKWNCTMCEAKCTSESQFESHCRSNRHRQKIQAILGKGKFAQASSSSTANEVPSDGSNRNNRAGSETAEKQQAAMYFCEVCNLLCDSSTALLHHRFGKEHRATLGARNESS